MSQESVETLRRLIDLWAQGPTDVPTELVAAPDIEFRPPLTSLRGRPIAGYDDAPASGCATSVSSSKTWEYAVDELREAGDRGPGLGPRPPEGSRPVASSSIRKGAWLAHFAADGRVSRMQVFTDRGDGPRSRRTLGVGDVAGERGDRATRLGRAGL